MVAVLTPRAGGKPIVIDKAVVLIGRHPDCDYVLQSSRKVSRRHVCVVQVNDRYMIRDLGSMNGVWVNEERVEREHPITIGDELSIGDVLYRFEEIQKMPRPPRKPLKESGQVDLAPDPPDEADVPRELKVPTPPGGVDLSQAYPVAIPEEDQSFAVVSDDAEPQPVSEPEDDRLVLDLVLDDDNPAPLIITDDNAIKPLGNSADEFIPVADFDNTIDEDDIDEVIVLDDPEELSDDDIIVLD